jgi:hypothetical protein
VLQVHQLRHDERVRIDSGVRRQEAEVRRQKAEA